MKCEENQAIFLPRALLYLIITYNYVCNGKYELIIILGLIPTAICCLPCLICLINVNIYLIYDTKSSGLSCDQCKHHVLIHLYFVVCQGNFHDFLPFCSAHVLFFMIYIKKTQFRLFSCVQCQIQEKEHTGNQVFMLPCLLPSWDVEKVILCGLTRHMTLTCQLFILTLTSCCV